MFRRAVTATLAAVLAEQAAATWEWEGRTLDSRQVAGECSPSTDSFAFVSKSQIPSAKTTSVESTVTSANKYTIDYHENFKVLTHSGDKQQYVLTQCGTTVPNATQVDAVRSVAADYTRKFFTVPLQKAIATETVGLGFIDALGLQDRVVSVSAYSVAPCWQKARMNCSAQEGGWSNATLEGLQKSSADGVFMNCASGCSSANSISFKTTDEVGNLHQAEYIKVMAAFFNKEEEANRIFEAKVTAYQALKVSAPATTVAWISYEPASNWNLGESFVLSRSDYKMQMVTDAGYTNVDLAALQTALPKLTPDTTVAAGTKYILKVADYASKAAAAEAFTAALSSVKVVIDEIYAMDPATYSINVFYDNYHLTSSSTHSFVQDQKVLRIDGTMSSDKNLDWYESRVANPEWALEGLRRSVTGDVSLRRKYFRNIAKSVEPEVLYHHMCAVDMPTCGAFLPTIILRDGVTETSSAKAPASAAAVALALLALGLRA